MRKVRKFVVKRLQANSDSSTSSSHNTSYIEGWLQAVSFAAGEMQIDTEVSIMTASNPTKTVGVLSARKLEETELDSMWKSEPLRSKTLESAWVNCNHRDFFWKPTSRSYLSLPYTNSFIEKLFRFLGKAFGVGRSSEQGSAQI